MRRLQAGLHTGIHKLPGLGVPAPKKHHHRCPTQPNYNTAEISSSPEKSRFLPFCKHPRENALHFLAILASVIPIDRPLQPLAK
jgi:hypothetical protein